MNEAKTLSKAELIASLSSSGEAAAASLRALPADTFELGRYESGWNGRQILAHIASIEWTYPRLIEVARQAQSPAETASVRPAPTSPAQGGINDYNERQVEKRASATVADLIAEFEVNRATTIAAFEVVDDALLRTPIRSAGGITGPLADVINAVAVLHVRGHVSDIAGSQP